MPHRTAVLRQSPRRWNRTVQVSLAVAMVVGVSLVASLWVLHRLASDAQELFDSGSTLINVNQVQLEATRVKTFVVEERVRASAGVATPAEAVQTVSSRLRQTRALLLEAAARGAPASRQLGAEIDALENALLVYLNSKSPATLGELEAAAASMDALAGSLVPAQSETATSALDDMNHGIGEIRLVLAATAIGGLPLIVLLIGWLGMRYGRLLGLARERERSLVAANLMNERRNAQFHGLYQVVTEVTDTLSLKYVVQTTVQQVRQLVDAELVVLRILDGSRLHAAGAEGDVLGTMNVIEDVTLGEGMVGRAARRGKILRADSLSEEAVLNDPGGRPEDWSGVVVPLIVGARVVGTVSCWTRRVNAFEDDLQVLEMMASQVATAIAAAGTHEESDRDAHIDALTQLPNRRQLAQDTRYEFDAAVERGRLLSVAMIDIDHFKRFNDANGHHGGDVALQRVADVMADVLRREDRIYRYGGEEFVVVFDALGSSEAADACERLRRAVDGAIVIEGATASVTISLGLATAPAMATTFDELLAAADEALYASKHGGRNRLTIAQPQKLGSEAA